MTTATHDVPVARAAATASRWRRPGWNRRTAGPTFALVAMCVVFSITGDRFRTFDNMRSILHDASVLAVIATGMTFVLLLGAIDLSVEGVIGTCSLSFALLVANTRNGMDLGPIAVVAVIAIGALFGAFSGAVTSGLRLPSFMTTLGVSSIGIGIASLLFGGDTPRIVDPAVTEWVSGRWFGLSRLTYVAVGAVVIGILIQRFTRLGRYASAIGGAEDIVALSGVSVRRYKIAVFTLAGAFYGLAAVMASVKQGAGVVTVASGENFTAITACVVGGTLLSGGAGGVGATLVGVLIVRVLDNGLVHLGVSPYLQTAVQGVVVVAAVAAATWPLRSRLRIVK